MKRPVIYLGLVLIFCLGATAGSLVTLGIMKRKAQALFMGGPVAAAEAFIRRATRQLDLTTDQRSALEKIVTRARLQGQEIRTEVQPRVLRIVESAITEFRATLTPKQAAQLDRILAERRNAWFRRRQAVDAKPSGE